MYCWMGAKYWIRVRVLNFWPFWPCDGIIGRVMALLAVYWPFWPFTYFFVTTFSYVILNHLFSCVVLFCLLS